MMKHGQMRAQLIAFGREMLPAQPIGPCKIDVAEQGRDDQRRDQIST